MKKLLIPFLLLGFTCLLINSCKDKSTFEDFTLEFGYEYFPLEVGKYRDYRVDSTTYDIGPGEEVIIKNSTTFVREMIADTITDNIGRPGFKIERFEKMNLADNWVIKDVWMTVRTEEQVETLEENLRFIKMVFPLKQGVVWNGNRFIDETTTVSVAGESVEVFKAWEYEVDFVGEAIAVNNEFFNNALQIKQADNENLIELRYSKEQYVKDIGLAFREMRILDTQNITNDLTWEEKAEKGFIMTQVLIDYN